MVKNYPEVIDLINRFKNPAGFIVLLLISVSFGFLLKSGGIAAGVLIVLMMAGPLVAFAVVAYPKFGIITLIIASNFLNLVLRMNFTSFPLGTALDGFQALLILGFIIKQKYAPDWSFLKTPVSVVIIIWILYNILQLFNPEAASRMAWVVTIRSTAIVMLTYFVFNYHIRSVEFIRLIVKVWLALSLFAAFYAFKQQYFGFFGFEEAYLYSDPSIMNLLFIGGEWRKFSIFADPTTFSYNMIISALLCAGMLFSPISIFKKIVLSLMIMTFIISMLFSGTRSAYVLLPAAMMMLTIIIFNKKMILFTLCAGLAMAALVFIPTSNRTLFRFQSAFRPSDDASFNVRVINQKRIKPYIRSHPLGGGLGSTGYAASKYSPGSFLANFPPDSGYVRVAVETGWVGLLLFCTLMFIILKTAIENYYKIKDKELKSYCLAMVLIVFALNIGNYPQEAFVQTPNSVYFYLVAALINITYNLDKNKNQTTT